MCNALGSVMEITDANQAAVASYRYDPYGNVTITRGGAPQTTDPLGQHWGFTGRFHDEESGLCYYRARYYDPATGRFLQRDPLGYRMGPVLFLYVRSTPPNYADPTGTKDPTNEERYAAIQMIDKLLEKAEEALDSVYATQLIWQDLIEAWKQNRPKGGPAPAAGGGAVPVPGAIRRAQNELNKLKAKARDLLRIIKRLRHLRRRLKNWYFPLHIRSWAPWGDRPERPGHRNTRYGITGEY